MAAQNLWLYGIFASYRDARIARGDEGYAHPVSRETLPDLVTAPFRPRVVSRAWFWAGLPVMVGAAVGLSALVQPQEIGRGVRSLGDGRGVWFLGRHHGTEAGFALGETYHLSLFLPVGVGEEAAFRGTLQPVLSEWLGVWPGWVATSLVFGAVHIFNFTEQEDGASVGLKAVPFITAVGGYLGLVSMRTGGQLETSVALHFWYDFLLSTINFVADPDHQPFALRWGLRF
jgi:membrane protease YdiL (CAAX protease family)